MTDQNMIEQVDLRKSQSEEVRAEEITKRRDYLSALGFASEWIDALAISRPTLYSSAVVSSHISGLSDRGFQNPTKMIESLPPILGYTFENIDTKIKGLSDRGFQNPTKMIESLPSILGYTFENIDRRLKLLDHMINLYDLPFEAPFLMEQAHFLFSSKIDKLWVLARVAKTLKPNLYDINTKTIRALLSANLEDVLVALNQEDASKDKIQDFIKRVRAVKRKNLPRDAKRILIASELDDFGKIKRRYFRGYP